MKRLTKELRIETADRKRFATFAREEFFDAAKMFVSAGYYAIDDIRLTQENVRQFFITDLRKSNQSRKTLKGLRLILDISQLFEIQKHDDKPKIWGNNDSGKMKKWAPALTDLRCLFLPGQDACNFFSFELAKGRCKKPPITPFVEGDFAPKPWMPNEAAHLRAHEGWVALQKPHKRPSNLAISFQAWIAYSLRFILVGDLTSAWKTFGGIAAQLTHMGTVLSIATLENATIAITYDTKVRHRTHELSQLRERDSEIIALLTNEGRRLKRESLRDFGFAQTFAHIPTQERKGNPGEKPARKGNNRKGNPNKHTKGKGNKNRKGRKQNGWNNQWPSNDWRNGKRNDWNQPSDGWSEGAAPDAAPKPSEAKTPGGEQKLNKKKK